jgi:hypothetical protein
MTITLNEVVHVDAISVAYGFVVTALKNDSARVTCESPVLVSAKRGSQVAMRTFGGMFVGLKVLPVRITIAFVESSNGGHINICASDALGFGVMFGMETKYHEAVADIMQVVVSSVATISVDRGGATPQWDLESRQIGRSPDPERGKFEFNSMANSDADGPRAVEPKFCGNCGSPRTGNRFCANCGAQIVT